MASARLKVRAATIDDVAAVGALQRSVGFKAHSEAGWRWLFTENPALASYASRPAQGWVLEGEHGVVGYLGNIPQAYVLDGQPLRAATCSGYVVHEGARGDSLKLLQAWFKQPEVGLFLSTTANAESEELYRLCKAEPPADASFRTGLVWVGADRPAVAARLDARGVPLARPLSIFGGPASRVARRLTGRARVPRHPGVAEVRARGVEAIDHRYDALGALLAAEPGLHLRRDAVTLRWMLSDPDAPAPVLLEVERDGHLVGWAVCATHHPADRTGPQVRLLDLVVAPGRAGLVPALLRAAADLARRAGAGLLYAPPCGAELSATLHALGAEAHPRAHQSHWIRAKNREDTARFVAAGVWRATGLDGDVPFCLEGQP